MKLIYLYIASTISLLSCNSVATEKERPLTVEEVISKIPNDTVRVDAVPRELINELQSFEKILVLHLNPTYTNIYSVFGKYYGFYHNKNISDNFTGNIGNNKLTNQDHIFNDTYGEVIRNYDVAFVKDGISTLKLTEVKTIEGNTSPNSFNEFKYENSFVTTYGSFSKTPSYYESDGSSVNLKGGHPIFKIAEFKRGSDGKIVKVIFNETVFKKSLDEVEQMLQEITPGVDFSVQEGQVEYIYDYYTSASDADSYFVRVRAVGGSIFDNVSNGTKSTILKIKDSKTVRVWDFMEKDTDNKKEVTISNYYEVHPDMKTTHIKCYSLSHDNSQILDFSMKYEINFNSKNKIADISMCRSDGYKSKTEFKYYYDNSRPIATEEYEIEFDDKGNPMAEKLRERVSISSSQ